MLSAPLNVHWELTNRCNLRCIHCYQQDDTPDHAIPGDAHLFTIADRIVDAGVFELTLTGGEILLVKQVFTLIDRFNAAGIEPHVTSNGTMVNDRRADELARRRLTFQVSIDSADASVHDGVRGRPGALRRAVEGIGRLVARGVPVSVAYTCMPQNVHDAAGVVALAEQLGVGRVCIGEVLPSFGAPSTREALEHDEREFDAATEELHELRRRFEGRVEVSLAFQGLPHRTHGDVPVCTALDRDLAILHDGRAYPCPFVRSPAYDLGSVLTTPLHDLWASPRAAAFRREKKDRPVPHCRTAAAASAAGAGAPSSGCSACPTASSTRSEVP